MSQLRGDRLRVWLRELNLKLAAIGPQRRYLKEAALVLATNDETLEWARRFGADRVDRFLDIGITEHFLTGERRRPPSSRPLRILWVGRIVPQKALPLAIAALSRMSNDATLTVAGDGPDHDRAVAYASTLGLGKSVRFLSHVPWKEMPCLYRKHDVFMFTSVLDSFGDQLLEAMGSGLPIVALNHQGAGSLVPDDASVKVEIGSQSETVQSLADALDLLADQPELRGSMGAAGYAFAKTHSWPERARAFTQIYESIVKKEHL